MQFLFFVVSYVLPSLTSMHLLMLISVHSNHNIASRDADLDLSRDSLVLKSLDPQPVSESRRSQTVS